MKITIVTLFPDMISAFLNESIIKKAQEKQCVEIEIINLRSYASDERGTVDDRPYGGGPGMIIMAEPVIRAIKDIKQKGKYKVIATSPRGTTFTQKKAQEYMLLDNLVIFSGHYEGMDERAMKYFDEEISIGDIILTGGELPAAIIVDSVVRLLPGVLKKEDAAKKESFFLVPIETLIEAVGKDPLLIELKNNNVKGVRLLEYPQYTRPNDVYGEKVPEVLLSGNPKDIEKWQLQQAYILTKKRRPDLLS